MHICAQSVQCFDGAVPSSIATQNVVILVGNLDTLLHFAIVARDAVVVKRE